VTRRDRIFNGQLLTIHYQLLVINRRSLKIR